MKKILLLVLALLSLAAAAQNMNAYRYTVMDPWYGNSMVQKYIAWPTSGTCIPALEAANVGDGDTSGPMPYSTQSCFYIDGTFTVTTVGGQRQISVVGPTNAQVLAGLGYTPVNTTDSRLSDARTPTAHTHTLAQLTDMTAAGRAIAQAADASAMRSLLSVPSIAEVAAAYYPLGSNPAGYITSAALSGYLTAATASTTYAPISHQHASADITSGTLALARIPSLPIGQTTGLQAAIDAKLAIPTCPTTQYLRGDASCATFPTIPTVPTINRAVIITATDGTYTWTFPTACPSGQVPAVSVTPQNNTSAEVINHKVTAVSNTSMTISTSRAVLTLTSIPLLSNITLPIIQTSPGAQTAHLIAICP